MSDGYFVLALLFIICPIIFAIIMIIKYHKIEVEKKEEAKKIENNAKYLDELVKKEGLSNNFVKLKDGVSCFIFDYDMKKFWYLNEKNRFYSYYSFDKIISCETRIKGQVSQSSTTGGLGRAVVGGLLAGGVGAVVGGLTANRQTETITNNASSQLLVYLNDEKNPLLNIEFYGEDSIKKCDQIYARFNAILSSNNQ